MLIHNKPYNSGGQPVALCPVSCGSYAITEVPPNNMHNNKWLVNFRHFHVGVWYLQ